MSEFYKVLVNRGGKDYETTEKIDVLNYKNEKIAEVCQSPDLLFTLSLNEARKTGSNKLRELSIDNILEIIKDAGNVFYKNASNELPYSFKEWKLMVTKATGLPISSVDGAGRLINMMAEMLPHAIDSQTLEGSLKSYDAYRLNNGMGYVPRGDVLGLITPSNHPAVHSLWLMALGVKYPIIHRPSNEEPFTAERLTQALYVAGMPEKTVYLLPGSHELANKVLESCDLGIVFGDEKTVAKYKDSSRIKAFGPGNSKIFVDEAFIDEKKVYALIRESVMRDGGRGCINTSQVVSTGDLSELVEKLAEDVTSVPYLEPTDKRAEIPATKENTAKFFETYIRSNLYGVQDITAKYVGDMIIRNDMNTTFLRPTIIKLDYEDFKKQNYSHPLWVELPFQYLVIIDNLPDEEFERVIRNTLTLSMYTDDTSKIERAIRDPTIKKVYLTQPTCEINPAEPHEGLFTDFLYIKKAIRFNYNNFKI